ncbi:MAG: hypothetical protein GY786_00905 [Proteobacteria bacterium]|nr:hypothetical protein [Pseudomonadota bacterium]
MENGKLWIFNYDFEFQLAGRGSIQITESKILPWYFLNRNAIILAPLLKPADSIIVYEKPEMTLLDHYNERSIQIPRMIDLKIKQQTLSAVDDFSHFISYQKKKGRRFAFWGLSPKAQKLITDPPVFNLIHNLNSKIGTNRLRENYLPVDWHIPSLELTDKTVTLTSLESSVREYLSRNGECLIKHAFGTAGRLIEVLSDQNISLSKLKRWLHWIKKEGGLLIEKKIEIHQEWSLQLHFFKDEPVQSIALTRLFNSVDRSYQGTIIHQADQRKLPILMKELQPVIDHITELGYQGPLGIDLIESQLGCFHLLEINARYTMGRLAYEWYKRSGPSDTGHFFNFFYPNSSQIELKTILNNYNSIVLTSQTKWSVINNIVNQHSYKSFITLYVESNSLDQCEILSDVLKNRLLNQLVN